MFSKYMYFNIILTQIKYYKDSIVRWKCKGVSGRGCGFNFLTYRE